MGAGNQQERLSITEAQRWFLAGVIEGEGSFTVSVKAHPSARYGYYVDPEFFIYQHSAYRELLELAKKIFGTGRIFKKPGNEEVLVFAITCRRSLKEKVIPFVKKYMIYSCRKKTFQAFIEIIEAMERREHWDPEGMVKIVTKAYSMNLAGKGKARKRDLKTVIDRILRGHTPDSPA